MPLKDKLVQIATEEWNFFGNQDVDFDIVNGKQVLERKPGHKEHDPGYYQRVGTYWKDALGEPYDGRRNIPWSAAFISYLMKKAGVERTQFLPSSQHSQYIRKSIVAKQNGDKIYGFWGYRPGEYSPEVGDLVCYVREKAVGTITYDTNSDDYDSHADLVVGKEGNKLKVIGGNVENSVTMKHLLLDGNGRLVDETKNWFVILKNLRGDAVAEAPVPPTGEQRRVTGDGVRLRSSPTMAEDNRLLDFNKGDLVDFYGASADGLWSKVGAQGTIGWMYNQYLQEVAPAGAAPPSPGSSHVHNIMSMAAKSSIVGYDWPGRGYPPLGYYQGMAMMFARLYCRLRAGDGVAKEIAKPAGSNPKTDCLAQYKEQFEAKGMNNRSGGVDTMRHLFVLMLGLGMRESSGAYCEGRDMNAENTASDTAEAGLFQTSFNVQRYSPLLPLIFERYKSTPDGFLEVFAKGVKCKEANWKNHGSGEGFEFQKLSKGCPGFAVEYTAVAMRNTGTHWGPIIHNDVEVKSQCNAMFLAVQQYVDVNGIAVI